MIRVIQLKSKNDSHDDLIKSRVDSEGYSESYADSGSYSESYTDEGTYYDWDSNDDP